jgi:hypothetical protein
MDARNSTGQAGAQPTDQALRPSPGHAAGDAGTPAGGPVRPAEDVEQLAPWEMSGQTDRPPTLPEPQPAPWLSSAPQVDAPPDQPDQPFEREITPWETGGLAAAPAVAPADPVEDELAADGPVGIEVPPWDAPPPFSFEQLVAEDDPYDAHAPLIDDFEPRRPAHWIVRPLMPAPSKDRPAPSIDEDQSSVFGDVFGSPPRPQPAFSDDQPAATDGQADAHAQLNVGVDVATSEVAPWAVDADDAAEWDAERDAAEWDAEQAAAEQHAAAVAPHAAAAEQHAAAVAPPDPINWPPVPTEFPLTSTPAPQAQHASGHDPLTWPPIPGDLMRVPDLGLPGGAPPTQPSVWDQPAAVAAEPVPADLPTVTASPASATDAAWRDFEPALPEMATDQPTDEPDPSVRHNPADEQRGAVFARFATTAASSAAEDEPRVSTMSPADEELAEPVAPANEADGDGGLWFLPSEPRESGSSAAAKTEDAEPSTIVTLVAMAVVGLIVIGAVMVFLTMFMPLR